MMLETIKYKARCGYIDISPGFDEFVMTRKVLNGQIIQDVGPIGQMFNEVQTEGDPDFRREKIAGEHDILFLDDPDYETKEYLRRHVSTKDLPATLDKDFIDRWALLARYKEEYIYNPPEHLTNIDPAKNFDRVMEHITTTNDETPGALSIEDYIQWREGVDVTKIKYKP